MISCYFENKNRSIRLRHVVVDVIAVKNNQILLVKRAKYLSGGNKWALPGGFLDHDETTREAALREFQEETGYQGKILKLFTIIDNPHRLGENRQNVSFVYLVKAIKQVAKSDGEVDAVNWFDLSQLPPAKTIAFDHLDIIKSFLKSSSDCLGLGGHR